MASINQVITQGIGAPAGIKEFILLGLQPDAGITFVDSSNNNGTAGTITLTIPTGTAEDDLMIAIVGRGGNGAQETWDDDGGGQSWTQLDANYTVTGRDEETAVYYKIAGASESNPTFTHGGSYALSGIIATFRNVNTTTPFDVVYTSGDHYTAHEDDSTPTNDAITTNNDNAWAIVMGHTNYADISVAGAPSGYTLRDSIVATNANIYLASKLVTSAGTETPGAWTHTASANDGESHTYTLALRPASAESTNYTLVFNQGSYAYTGQDFALDVDYILSYAQGSYAYTGYDLAFPSGHWISFGSGSYAYTGQDFSLLADYSLAISQGSYTYTGYTFSLTYSGDTTATPAERICTATVEDRTYTIVATDDDGNRTYTILTT